MNKIRCTCFLLIACMYEDKKILVFLYAVNESRSFSVVVVSSLYTSVKLTIHAYNNITTSKRERTERIPILRHICPNSYPFKFQLRQ